MAKPLAKGLGPAEPDKSPDVRESIADALEIALGARPDDEQVAAFCAAVELAGQVHYAEDEGED